MTKTSAVLALALLAAPPLAAQTRPMGASGAAGSEKMAVQPIECWWRTSANAVRVGELFSVILTCAVLDTTATTVVPDQSRLDPSVLQLRPFEVTGGSQAADLRTPSRRFFQYEYTLRYIGEDFGRDVPLPQLSVAYRVQSRVEKNAAAIESRDRQYMLPSQTIRIESLVPFNATDIRDRAPDTFRGIEQRRFRATILRIIFITLMIASAATALWALVRYFTRLRAKTAQMIRLASDGAVLREVGRELADVSRRRQIEGWTSSLAARALAALRIVGAYAVAGHASQSAWTRGVALSEGQILVRSPFQPGKTAVVSGAVTAITLEREMRRRESTNGHSGALSDLHDALQTLNHSAYGQEGASNSDLDGAMTSGARALGMIQRENAWFVKRLNALTRALGGARSRAWAR